MLLLFYYSAFIKYVVPEDFSNEAYITHYLYKYNPIKALGLRGKKEKKYPQIITLLFKKKCVE